LSQLPGAAESRIYRVATEFRADGRSQRVALASGLLAPMLTEEFADVQAYVRFTPPGSWSTATDRVIRHGEKAFTWAATKHGRARRNSHRIRTLPPSRFKWIRREPLSG
jgi:hypothetical protein